MMNIKVKINDQTYEFEENLSVEATLKQLDRLETTGIAVAINNEVIPKANWQQHTLENNDELLIITATQGG